VAEQLSDDACLVVVVDAEVGRDFTDCTTPTLKPQHGVILFSCQLECSPCNTISSLHSHVTQYRVTLFFLTRF